MLNKNKTNQEQLLTTQMEKILVKAGEQWKDGV